MVTAYRGAKLLISQWQKVRKKKGKGTRIPVSFQGHTRGDVTPFLLGPIVQIVPGSVPVL